MVGKKGFTLIELLVVIIIIGILAAISIPMMTANVKRARQAEAQAALGTVRTAERIYRTEHGKYTSTINDLMVTTADLDGIYYDGDVTIAATTDTFIATMAHKTNPTTDYKTLTDLGVWGGK